MSRALLSFAQKRLEMNRFRRARIGKGLGKKLNREVRKDQIYWVEEWNVQPFVPYHEVLSHLTAALRRELFLPIKRFEGHLAYYAPGGHYLPHVDRHQVEPHRLISTVLYLNDVNEGGELLLYTDKREVRIQPKLSKLIVFRSDLLHEVLPTQEDRFSLTSWFRDDVL